MNIPSEEPNMSRKRERKKGITREEIQAREYLRIQEQEKLDKERSVRKSTRIQNKRAMKCYDKKIPSTVREAKSSEWEQWRGTMKDDLIARPKGKKVIKCK
ncbi:hypothetical protein WN51_13334 [Melipona quadrifasciata]|uniref:Uncharacterized protein n=1 Tax=Melipona quadrifasciata TaxID=166423 RepID=A0A0M9A2B8_9HYME|nr:hypothetical protein WN51_13334 [Melipona quadrifasciata]